MKQALEKFSEAFQRLNPNNLDQLDDIHLISEETRVKVMSICEESD